MKLNKIIIISVVIFSMSINGCSSIYNCIGHKSSVEKQTILNNRKVNFNNISKINKILSSLKGSDFLEESKMLKEHGEKVLQVSYSQNESSGEGDYINFWNYTNKKEVIISNSIYMFLLIDEMDKMKVKLNEPIDEEFVIRRSDIEDVYGVALENYIINEESLKELLIKDNIEELWFKVNS